MYSWMIQIFQSFRLDILRFLFGQDPNTKPAPEAESITRGKVRIDRIFYPNSLSLPSARILAAVGDNNDLRWYSYAELLLHDGAEEELRRWGLSQ